MTVLNYADKIEIGTGLASKVYVGSTQVWPRFIPTSISGCVIWLDASKLALADGAAVSSWTNLGSGPQPTLFGSGAPVFRTNAVNTIMPVVRQTGTQGKFRFAGTGVDKEYTIAFVARKWSSTIGRLFSTPPANNVLFGWWSNRMDLCHNTGWLAPDIVTPGTTAWKLYSADQTTASMRFFSNGTLLRSSTTVTAGLGGALWFGGYDDTTEFGDGDYAEVILYNRKLTDAERQAVEKYLREKWMGLPLWSPSDLGANLTAWFDSSDVSTVQLAGQGVNNWVNKKAGGTMTLTQSVNDTYRPTINNGDGVSFALAQGMNAAGGPASFDVFVVGKPNPHGADPINWRTLLRSAQGHEIILEDKSPRLGIYNAGFFNAIVGLVGPSNMTSNTTPAPFVASASSQYDANYQPYYSFDGNPSTYSHSLNPTTTEPYWIKIDLGTAKYVTGYTYQVRPEASAPQQWKDWLFQGSNDNSVWTTVDTVTNNPIQAAGSAVAGYACDNPGTYRYYRWYVTAGQNYSPPYAAAAALELYEGLTWPVVEGLCFARIAPSTVVQMSRDGGVLRSAAALAAGSAAPTMFGCYMGPPPTQGFGAVREIIFVPYNLESERQRIEGYLAHKWGLQALLPAGHPYKATPP